MNDNLKPCPFCKSNNIVLGNTKAGMHVVFCANCGSESDYRDKKTTVDTWNRRDGNLNESGDCPFCNAWESEGEVELEDTLSSSDISDDRNKFHSNLGEGVDVYYRAYCYGCNVSGPLMEHPEDAEDAWKHGIEQKSNEEVI